MTRREALRILPAVPALKLLGQKRPNSPPAQNRSAQGDDPVVRGSQRPDSFKVYTESPRLLLRPQRLKLLRRERERRSLGPAVRAGNRPRRSRARAGA